MTQALAAELDESLVLPLAARHAAGLLEAPHARVWLLDEGGFLRPAVTYGEPGASSRMERLPRDSVAGLVASQGRLNVEDVLEHPAWLDVTFTHRTGLRTYLGVPIQRADQSLGVLEVMREPGRPFDLGDEELLIGLANAVAVAIGNARILARVREQEAKWSAILEQLPSGVVVLDAAGQMVLMNAAGRHISGAAPGGPAPRTEQTAGSQLREPLTDRPLTSEETPIARALAGETVASCEYVFRHPGESADAWIRASAAPLRSVDGQITGAVAVFTDVTHERRLVRELSATALENARLLGELSEHERRLRALAEKLGPNPSQVREAEKRREAFGRLTPREHAVLRLVAGGLTNRAIAEELHLSTATVKVHVEHILAKLGVADRTHAAVIAIKLGVALPSDAR